VSSGGPDEAQVFVSFSDEQTLNVDERRLVELARRTAESEGATGEISITLVDSGRMLELNQRYLGESHATDVLAFPIDEEAPGAAAVAQGGPPRLIGEVVICPEVALRQSEAGLDAEMLLLVAHGVLHLLGYDHDSEDDAAGMRRRELDLTGRSGARARSLGAGT
jgi:probable rRNA maturation factor